MRWLILLSLVSLSLLLLVEESEGWWSRRRRTSNSPPPSSRRRYSYSPPPSTKRRRSYYTRRRRSSSSGCGYLYCYNGGRKYCASGWWSSKKVAKCKCPSKTTGRQCERYKCPSKSCHNGGTKYCQRGIAYCRCKQGYSGAGCRNGCGTKTCYNGGQKYCASGLWGRKVAKCRCPLGWGKHDCGTAVCPRLGCKNKGTRYCSKGNAYCKCQPGFYGSKCEKGCPPKSCKNGGIKTCHNGFLWGSRVAKCKCPNGYGGAHCGKVVCPHVTCHNGGTKYCSKPGVASCRCRPGFYKRNCKKGCPPKLCKNGGIKTCHRGFLWGSRVSKCRCPSGYSGPLCGKGKPKPRPTKKPSIGICLLGSLDKKCCSKEFGIWSKMVRLCKKDKISCGTYGLSLCFCYDFLRRKILKDYNVKTKFFLVTGSGTDVPIYHDRKRKLSKSYDSSKNTVIIIHGFTENRDEGWIKTMKKALLNKVNVILAEWETEQDDILLYCMAAARTQKVGKKVAKLVQFLSKYHNKKLDSFHLIGFSLGAQVAGYAGSEFKSPKIGRITGLDPAGPFFGGKRIDKRLDESDAKFVDVIHTDASRIPFTIDLKHLNIAINLGTATKSGHFDFWPNGGNNQKGCKPGDWYCDHMRAPKLFTESITSTCQFTSYRCNDWKKFQRGRCKMNCSQNSCAEMGYNAVKNAGSISSGNFYLRTSSKSPYCIKQYGK